MKSHTGEIRQIEYYNWTKRVYSFLSGQNIFFLIIWYFCILLIFHPNLVLKIFVCWLKMFCFWSRWQRESKSVCVVPITTTFLNSCHSKKKKECILDHNNKSLNLMVAFGGDGHSTHSLIEISYTVSSLKNAMGFLSF